MSISSSSNNIGGLPVVVAILILFFVRPLLRIFPIDSKFVCSAWSVLLATVLPPFSVSSLSIAFKVVWLNCFLLCREGLDAFVACVSFCVLLAALWFSSFLICAFFSFMRSLTSAVIFVVSFKRHFSFFVEVAFQ